MTTTASIPPITGTVTVGVPAEQAFEVFTGSFTSWWPHVFHIGRADVAEVVLEPHVGGRVGLVVFEVPEHDGRHQMPAGPVLRRRYAEAPDRRTGRGAHIQIRRWAGR
jgi:hypothetical protein